MTPPMQPLTDERLDRLVRELLTERAEDVAASALSAEAMVEQIAARLRPGPLGRTWVLLAAAMLTSLLIGGALIVGGQPRVPSLVSPAPLPTAVEGVTVHGWPSTGENRAGVYSWDGSSARPGTSSNKGFMHNGYGSGDVEIRISVLRGGAISDGSSTPVTVAGHDGMYRRIDAHEEEWIVEIEETTISIQLTARPGTIEADLAEAHAIIDSLRAETRDTDLGFRLLFTLTTDDWDSG